MKQRANLSYLMLLLLLLWYSAWSAAPASAQIRLSVTGVAVQQTLGFNDFTLVQPCPGDVGQIYGGYTVMYADECYSLHNGRLLTDGSPLNGEIELYGATATGIGSLTATARTLTFAQPEGGSVTWRVNAPGAAHYIVEFRYRLNEGSDRAMNLYVNNRFVRELSVPVKTYGTGYTDPVLVRLNNGDNDIRLVNLGHATSASIETLALDRARYLTDAGGAEAEPSPHAPECTPGLASYLQPQAYRDSYYGKVDPGCERKTLTDWKRVTGFLICSRLGLAVNTSADDSALKFTGTRQVLADAGASASMTTLDGLAAQVQQTDGLELCMNSMAVEQATYINAYDLGFGRKMFCLDNGQPSRTACYVDNYLNPTYASPAARSQPAIDNAALAAPNTFAATVTMERMTVAGSQTPSVVAFFVYDADGRRINQIALDNEGPKPVPESCYACHQGRTDNAGVPYGGVFLPFDIDAYQDWAGEPTRDAQEEDFRALNQIVYEDAQGTGHQPMMDLIESWYGGQQPAASAGDYTAFRDFWDASPDPDHLPQAGWFSTHGNFAEVGSDINAISRYIEEWNLYVYGYAKYCRLCHVAQDNQNGGFPQQSLAGSATAFRSWLQNRTCSASSSSSRMPHAEFTDRRFDSDEFPMHGSATLSPTELCDY